MTVILILKKSDFHFSFNILSMCLVHRLSQYLKKLMRMFFRYQRGSRSLAANLSMSQSTTVAVTPEVEMQEQEEDYDIPEEVETVIGQFQPPLSL